MPAGPGGKQDNMEPYKIESANATINAQRNLMGRTHYVDPDTLRFHKSRILKTVIADGGLLFALVESASADMDNTKRGFRYAIFDVFGRVLDRPKLEEMVSRRATAEKAMFKALDNIDAKAITREAIERAEKHHADEMARLRAYLETELKAVL